jgi:hypothetical protein
MNNYKKKRDHSVFSMEVKRLSKGSLETFWGKDTRFIRINSQVLQAGTESFIFKVKARKVVMRVGAED